MKDDSQDDSREFRRFAKECMRLAEQVQSVEDKAVLLSMAKSGFGWRTKGIKSANWSTATARARRETSNEARAPRAEKGHNPCRPIGDGPAQQPSWSMYKKDRRENPVPS
jgi:hypothetical protein